MAKPDEEAGKHTHLQGDENENLVKEMREGERARGERGGGNQRVPVCLALLRLIHGRTCG